MQARHYSKLLPIGWQFSKKTNKGPHKECQTVIPFKKAQQTVHWYEWKGYEKHDCENIWQINEHIIFDDSRCQYHLA